MNRTPPPGTQEKFQRPDRPAARGGFAHTVDALHGQELRHQDQGAAQGGSASPAARPARWRRRLCGRPGRPRSLARVVGADPTRRSRAMSKLSLVAAAAAGYVLGAHAGRKRYEQIKTGAPRRSPATRGCGPQAKAARRRGQPGRARRRGGEGQGHQCRVHGRRQGTPRHLDPARPLSDPLELLDAQVVECRACPRLVEWREPVAREKRAAYANEDYWGRPITGFGARHPRVLIIGLAPAAHGANRTGRTSPVTAAATGCSRACTASAWPTSPPACTPTTG